MGDGPDYESMYEDRINRYAGEGRDPSWASQDAYEDMIAEAEQHEAWLDSNNDYPGDNKYNQKNYNKIMAPQCINTKIVGVTYKNPDGVSRQSLLSNCSEKSKLILTRDRHNKYDVNCINVCIANGDILGHLSKEIAARLAPEMDKGKKYTVKIANLTGGGRYNIGCNINIFGDLINNDITNKDLDYKSQYKSTNYHSSTSIHERKSTGIYPQHSNSSSLPGIMERVSDRLILGFATIAGKIVERHKEELRKEAQQDKYELIYDSKKGLLGWILAFYIRIVSAHVVVSWILIICFVIYLGLALFGCILWLFDYNVIFPYLLQLNNITFQLLDWIALNGGKIILFYIANLIAYLAIYFRERNKFYENVPKNRRNEVIFRI